MVTRSSQPDGPKGPADPNRVSHTPMQSEGMSRLYGANVRATLGIVCLYGEMSRLYEEISGLYKELSGLYRAIWGIVRAIWGNVWAMEYV